MVQTTHISVLSSQKIPQNANKNGQVQMRTSDMDLDPKIYLENTSFDVMHFIPFLNVFETNNSDFMLSLLVDDNGYIYLIGTTFSSSFPTLNALQPVFGGLEDIFLMKLEPDGETVVFSTYIGGSGEDKAENIHIDQEGNILILGITTSPDFPTINAFDNTFGGGDTHDFFLIKISSNGQEFLFSTFFGGSNADFGGKIITNDLGEIIIYGRTFSNDFPTKFAYNSTFGGGFWGDTFLAKFSSNGQTLLFSTYLGGSGTDWSGPICIDNSGNFILSGYTTSPDFPTKNALQTNLSGPSDIFISKISQDGQTLLSSTYLGGSSSDNSVFNMIADNIGNIYITGSTNSLDFPTVNAFDTTFNGSVNGYDGFILKLSPDLQAVLFSSYIGGIYDDEIRDIAVDDMGNIYLGGWTDSPDFPLINAFDTTFEVTSSDQGPDPYGEGFLMKIAGNNYSLLFSTYLGGNGQEKVEDIAIDNSNNIYLNGWTTSSDFPIFDAFDESYTTEDDYNYSDGFISIISAEGNNFLYSTYIGGSKGEGLNDIFLDNMGNFYITGHTYSLDFPKRNPITSNDKSDIFFIFFSNDIDHDGMFNPWEEKYGLNPTLNDALADFDNDGMNNFYEYQMGLLPNFDDSQQDLDGDGMPNLWEFQNGLLASFNDSQEDLDNDGFLNIVEYQLGLRANYDDSQEDLDGDGLPNLFEYLHGLSIHSDDSQGDLDADGIPNLWEYQMNLQIDQNDSLGDKDLDGMPNLWEYQNDLLANTDDRNQDKDGDWVTNRIEYASHTKANDYWSFPLLYSEFPFILNAPIFLLTTISGSIIVTSVILIVTTNRKKLVQKLGAPDYQTAKQMLTGGFNDFETFQKAQALHISSLEEYKFTLELQNTFENNKET